MTASDALDLWALCSALRDEGVTYHQYAIEIGRLVFLRLAQQEETDATFPEGARWRDLVNCPEAYPQVLTGLSRATDPTIRSLFAGASTALHERRGLQAIIGELDRATLSPDTLPTLYEALLARNAAERRSGAGQYFTPRPLVDAMVRVLQPAVGERVCDPAAGTGGFLIAAAAQTDGLRLSGLELVEDTHQLGRLNLSLRGLDARYVHGDALGEAGRRLPPADLVLTNPPFGAQRGAGRPTRPDLPHPTSNKALCFVQHVQYSLRSGGRAGMVVPDGILSAGGVAARVRHDLLSDCRVHTVLRLPMGMFYAPGIKATAIFFERGQPTERIWFYDLRTGVAAFGKKRPLHDGVFADFVRAYGEDPAGQAPRSAGQRFFSLDRRELPPVDVLDVARPAEAEGVEAAPDLTALHLEARALLRAALDDLDALDEVVQRT